MARYARGTHALAICQRCGFRVDYLKLKEEWTGLWVCPDCYEPKHPQLETPRVRGDAEALRHPSPEVKNVRVLTVGASLFHFENPHPVSMSATIGAVEVEKV